MCAFVLVRVCACGCVWVLQREETRLCALWFGFGLEAFACEFGSAHAGAGAGTDGRGGACCIFFIGRQSVRQWLSFLGLRTDSVGLTLWGCGVTTAARVRRSRASTPHRRAAWVPTRPCCPSSRWAISVSSALVETPTRVRKGYDRNCNSFTACTMVLRC